MGAPAAGVAAAPASGGLAPLTLRTEPGEAQARRTAGASPLRSATVRFSDGAAAGGAAARGGWRVRGWRTNGFAQVGATWRGADPVLQARSRPRGGRWGAWQRLGSDRGRPHHGLRRGPFGPARSGPVVVRGRERRAGPHPGVRAPGAEGRADRPRGRPGRRPTGREAGLRRDAGQQARKKKPERAPRPRIFGRRAWGANESWRENPRYISTILAVHVHHTVNANGYSRRDVPGLIRGMYRYHTKSLGWSDIGYNLLVDRFGRAWAGRAGGPGKRVRGAHTLGFNENGAGIAVIGNFETGYAPRAARWKVSVLAAWKLDKEGRNPARWRPIWSHGSDRYPRGSRPRLPRVAGHRDTNQTACPGIRLYSKLGGIRRFAQKRVDQFS